MLHGWASREFLIPSARERAVVTTNGIFRPTILAGGQVKGVWKMPGGKVDLDPFGRLDAREAGVLESDVADLIRFLAG